MYVVSFNFIGGDMGQSGCKHKNINFVSMPLISHPLSKYIYVIQNCKDCGSSRIAEYEKDLDGQPLNMVAAFQWRGSV
jgi:hypothetical protein